MDIHTLEVLGLFLLISVVLFAGVAKRINVPYPILLVLAGLVISFVPRVPRIPLNPDLVFLLFLPPLLYASAWQTNWREFRRNLVSITMLATGLVGFTVLGIAFFADHFVTTLDFTSGFLLGAVVAATDAVAAGSIARTLGLSPRITGLLEGESLVNDATGLLALEFGITLLTSGHSLSIPEATFRLLWLIAGGLGVGLLLGHLMIFVERWITDGPLEMAASLIVPYVAYLAAEELRASGVLAVVACGLYLSRRSASYLSPAARLQILSAWGSLDFVLNGVVFLLIGLQLPYILAGIHQYSNWTLVLYGLTFSLVLIALRMAWVFPGAHISFWIRRRFSHQPAPIPETRSLFVIGWSGMRGVLSLAAAFSLPVTLSNGQPFRQRSLILFLTFSIILVTLVGQGLTLPPLIHRLGLAGNSELEDEMLAARYRVLSSAVEWLQQQRENASGDDIQNLDELLRRYQQRVADVTTYDRITRAAGQPDEATRASAIFFQKRVALLRHVASIERRTLLKLRDENAIGDEVMRTIERELDLTETRFDELT
ncbi:Na+/H+ antiporter [Granulicella sp. 5B5]|uniref:Na+/H+ antiporter n=1 Tax=Granulicella sp. 5B5 TaxID=1617967 RepID=UPI0015F68A7F|nr:Na+/H+ antiporter [Granulicella sp. 5B5]QMV18983.1 Na+/H+ antiporter [Granulicella sp. 5B5]